MAGKMMGQGSTEYLVVLSVATIVGLVVIYLLTSPFGSSQISETESHIYWKGEARPLRIVDAGLSNNSSQYALIVENSEATGLTLTGIAVDNSSSNFSELGGTPNTPVTFGPGEKKTVSLSSVTALSSCTPGQYAELLLRFTYTSEYGMSRTQTGEKKYVVVCTGGGGGGDGGPPACGAPGSACTVDGNCCTGNVCVGGSCTATCSGRYCSETEECCSGFSCYPNDQCMRTCCQYGQKAVPVDNYECVQCCDGMIQNGLGVCVNPSDLKNPCQGDEDCVWGTFCWGEMGCWAVH